MAFKTWANPAILGKKGKLREGRSKESESSSSDTRGENEQKQKDGNGFRKLRVGVSPGARSWAEKKDGSKCYSNSSGVR